MGERKVLNKYYPPDFDPAKVPKRERPKNMQCKIRMMLPMSVRCCTCGEFMYQGKKFNSRKELVEGMDYLGIKIFRFYMKCVTCSAEFTIRTDPQNQDYTCEEGVARNFEPWRGVSQVLEDEKKARAKDEENDTMRALENRTTESRREMDILDALEDIRMLNARGATVTPEEVLDSVVQRTASLTQAQEDEVLFNSRVAALKNRTALEGAGSGAPPPSSSSSSSTSSASVSPAASNGSSAQSSFPSGGPPSLFDQIALERRLNSIPSTSFVSETAPVVVEIKKKKKKKSAKRQRSAASDPTPANVEEVGGLAGLAAYN